MDPTMISIAGWIFMSALISAAFGALYSSFKRLRETYYSLRKCYLQLDRTTTELIRSRQHYMERCKELEERLEVINPDRYGKWIYDPDEYDNWWECSVCGHLVDDERIKRCPWCKAQMEMEEEYDEK